LCKLCENRARDVPLWGVYIPHFDQISVKISVLGVLYLYRCTNGVEFGTEEGMTFGPPPCQISPHRCNVSPLRGEKPQKRPLSSLNTGALRNAAGNKQTPLKTSSSLCYGTPVGNRYSSLRTAQVFLIICLHNHHSSDDVYCRGGADTNKLRTFTTGSASCGRLRHRTQVTVTS